MKRVRYGHDLPGSWRVAMVVTKAPSEPFSLVKKTLEAMLEQDYPHDNWLADEDPTTEVFEWCNSKGIKVSTRKNIPEYHRDTWPRRTRCKEGNLAYFYDHYGYEKYDFVIQLDADHVPEKGYLKEMLKPFVLNDVGYVSAPSICDSNADSSWAARGRLHAESIMHGTLQAGYSYDYAPLCIGSHYAVRTKALKEIGGLGPELAEDHSTTMLFQAAGWKGVHAFDAIAHGEGPQTLKDLLVQEFQWSRSLVILLFTLLPAKWSQLPRKMKVQFLFSELWYPVFGFTMLIGYLLPIMAIISDIPWVNVSFLTFLAHSLPLMSIIFAIVIFLKNNGLLRPHDSPVISWEMALFQFVRWPWALYGCLMGFITAIAGRSPNFLVTPKGKKVSNTLDSDIIVTLLLIMILSFIPVFLTNTSSAVYGYYFFLILNLCVYSLVIASTILLHRQEAKKINQTIHE